MLPVSLSHCLPAKEETVKGLIEFLEEKNQQ